MYAESTQILLSSLSSLQKTSDYSDLTIFCGNDVHRVHKAIVCPRSRFFASACRIGQEALRNEVALPEDDPKLVKLMIDYLYQLDYEFKPESCNGVTTNGEPEINQIPEPDSPVAQVIERFEDMSEPPLVMEEGDFGVLKPKKTKSSKKKRHSLAWSPPPVFKYQLSKIEESVANSSKSSELNVHAQMYALADKYGIHDLKELARDKFAEAASHDWDGKDFPMAVHTVYSSTLESDYGLRNVVVDTLSRHRELLEKPEVEALVKEVNGLAFGLLKTAWGLWQQVPSEPSEF